jgi:protein SCO1
MAEHHAASDQAGEPTALFDGAFRLVVILGAILGVLLIARMLADAVSPAGGNGAPDGPVLGVAAASGTGPTPGASVDLASFMERSARAAPDVLLTGPDGQPVSLASLRGTPVLIFFGFTHCADVCPATIGTVGLAIDAYGKGARAIFVSIDPERDTVPWLAEFVRFMPAGFTAVTGTAAEVEATADAWGVRYARVETDDPANYEMSHTADVFLVDAAGQLRARFPFGTEAEQITAVLHSIESTTPSPAPTVAPSATSTPTSAPTATPAVVDLWPRVVSSSVWSGGASPVILSLYDSTGQRLNDPTLRVTAQILDSSGSRVGQPAAAIAVQPWGVAEVSFVPTLDIPAAGRVRLAIDAVGADGGTHFGIVELDALDPGATAALGAPAPAVRTPTAADFGGDLTWVTTDPLPDPRMSATSTTDALAAGTPFVLVVDSVRFRVTPACGKAVVLAKRLGDRWRDVSFIHLEPYRYQVVTSEPVLEGTLAEPRLTDPAEAWGVGAAPWSVGSMPWIFIVDENGIVRAKYQGVVGSADVDVILALLTQAG